MLQKKFIQITNGRNWNEDYSYFVSSGNSGFLGRGGNYIRSTNGGIFCSMNDIGTNKVAYGVRIVLPGEKI